MPVSLAQLDACYGAALLDGKLFFIGVTNQRWSSLGVGGPDFFFVVQDPIAGGELYVYMGEPEAADVTGVSSGGKPVQFSVLSSAYEPGGTIDISSVRVEKSPSHGMANVGADGVITYTPISGYSGDDSFAYTVADSAGITSAPAQATVKITESGGGAVGALDLVLLFVVLLSVHSLRVGRGTQHERAAISQRK